MLTTRWPVSGRAAAFALSLMLYACTNPPAFAGTPPATPVQAVCGARGALVARLAREHDERPVARALAAGGRLVEVLAAPGGSWTLLVTLPDGRSCAVAAGTSWETLPASAGPES